MRCSKGRVGFLSLPAELRNRIYELVLITFDDENEEGGLLSTDITLRCPARVRSSLGCQPSLSRTCRTIRAETLPIFYGCNEFRHSINEAPFALLVEKLSAGTGIGAISWTLRNGKLLGNAGAWLRAIGRDNAALIKSLEFKIGDFCWDFCWGFSPAGPPALHRDLTLHAAEISAVLSDYLRRENIPLPACTKLLVYDCRPDFEGWSEEGEWKRAQLPLPLLEEGRRGKGWDMVV